MQSKSSLHMLFEMPMAPEQSHKSRQCERSMWQVGVTPCWEAGNTVQTSLISQCSKCQEVTYQPSPLLILSAV